VKLGTEHELSRRSVIIRAAVVAGIALLAAGLGIGIYRAATLGSGESSEPAAVTTDTTETGTTAPLPAPIADLYDEVSPGVVEVAVSGVAGTDPFGPFESPGETAAQGSGFVVDDDGTILTNEHVVEGAESIEVRFADGRTVDAELVGTDASTDVAVLRVDVPADELAPLELGDSSAIRVGEGVVAIGSPFGLEGSITAGIVSAVGRTVRAPNGFSIVGAIQTDAAVNSGSSGGPLLNLAGEVIGINSQIESRSGGNVGVGFAVPIDAARRAAEAILAGETVAYPYLGVRLADAASGGAEVAAVQPGGPADDAGVEDGDVVVAVDGQEVGAADDLATAIASRAPGDEVTLTVERDGETVEIEVTLGRRPS
jgi:putative serine protease PepD